MGCTVTKVTVSPSVKLHDRSKHNLHSNDSTYHIQSHISNRESTSRLKSGEPAKSIMSQAEANKSPSLPNAYSRSVAGRVKVKTRKGSFMIDKQVSLKYSVMGCISSSPSSIVLKVTERSSRQQFVIKILKKIIGSRNTIKELDILYRIRHQYIIALLESYESKSEVYLVMELATGGDLFDRLVSLGNFTETDAVHILQMILQGIQYLHHMGITHRDLKPENILFYHTGKNSKVLISDFGLSALCVKTGIGDPLRTLCGTPEYIAPEVLAQKPYTFPVDMWAVGVITYVLLSGKLPFYSDNNARLFRLILKVTYSYEPQHWKDVSPLAKDFIDKLLVLDPEERITSAKALKHPWITTMAASSSNKNLHRTISKNLLERQSTRNSVKSAKSTKSNKSNKSNKSSKSIRSEHRRVMPEEIDELHKDPEVQAELSSLHSSHGIPCY